MRQLILILIYFGRGISLLFTSLINRVVLSGLMVVCALTVTACGELAKPSLPIVNGNAAKTDVATPTLDEAKVLLGQRLFFDPNLSMHRNQSCASCHSPTAAFSDPAHTPVSAGSPPNSFGGRNTPTIAYSRFSPSFGLDAKGRPRGGHFWDGRANGLKAQATQPIFNPVEMAMPSPEVLVERIKEQPGYVDTLVTIFGQQVFDPAQLVNAIGESLAAFERTEALAPFKSKYDRFLAGEVALSPQEELGRTLFFSQQFTNCNQCHQLARTSRAKQEVFTDFTYHNIGVPKNLALSLPTDLGLAANANFDQKVLPSQPHKNHKGKFKVPTLRNVELTAPYMHNGVFNDLKTVVQFYNKFNSRAASAQINPETGLPWGPAEVPESVSLKELESGPALDEVRVDALVAFLKTLTDEPYRQAAN